MLANAVANYFIYQQWNVANRAQIDLTEQLRAVVTFIAGQQILIKDKDNADKIAAYGFVAQFQNFGETRTGRFKAWNSIRYFDGAIPNNLDLTKPLENIDISDVTSTIIRPYNSLSKMCRAMPSPFAGDVTLQLFRLSFQDGAYAAQYLGTPAQRLGCTDR